MASTYMPLRSAFIAAAEIGADKTVFSHRLLRDLQTGAVRAICASYIKAQFRYCGIGIDYAETIDQLVIPAECKDKEKKKDPQFVDSTYNVCIDGDYYTFVEAERGIVAYADLNPHLAPGAELSHEFLSNALINEDRSEIFCVDVPNKRRRTYEKVELLRSDVNNMLGLLQEKIKPKRGAKQKYFLDESVVLHAKNLLRKNYNRIEWEGHVREAMSVADQMMGEKTFSNLYGAIWTEDNEAKRKRGK